MPAGGLARTPRSSTLALLASERAAYAFYRWENVAINLWASQPNAPAVEIVGKLTERSLLECPKGIASIHCIANGAGLPTSEARAQLAEIAKRYDRHLLCVAILLRGDGFWASAVRSALTGIVLLAPRAYQMRFYGELTPLSRFVTEQVQQRTGEAHDRAQLLGAVEQALREFDVGA
jgi:hypothetical protein